MHAQEPSPALVPPHQTLTHWTIYLLAFTGGFIIMSIELLGGRILAPWFGSSIFVWGSIITVFMVALSTGYLVGGQLSLLSPSLGRYGIFFLVAAITTLPIIYHGELMMAWIFLYVDDPRYGSLLAATSLFFIPTAILGMIAPYSVRLLVENVTYSGKVAGGLFFVSTLGSAIGTLLTSFYLVLWFEINQIMTTLVGLLLLCFLLAFSANRSIQQDHA